MLLLHQISLFDMVNRICAFPCGINCGTDETVSGDRRHCNLVSAHSDDIRGCEDYSIVSLVYVLQARSIRSFVSEWKWGKLGLNK